MTSRSKRLLIPAQLRTIMVGSVAAFACASTPSTTPPKDGGPLSEAGLDTGQDANIDSGRDTLFDGGPCLIKVPAGKVCETTCYNIRTDPISVHACQIYCAPAEGGPGTCSCDGGVEPEPPGGLCPGGASCELQAYSDGGTQVLC